MSRSGRSLLNPSPGALLIEDREPLSRTVVEPTEPSSQVTPARAASQRALRQRGRLNARSLARMAVLQALYEADVTGHGGAGALDRLLASTQDAKAADVAFARRLLSSVEASRTTLDTRIAELAPSWPPSQLSAVDRNILRMALAEMQMDDLTPRRVVVNEAIELAKVFGSEGAPKLINGALRSMLG